MKRQELQNNAAFLFETIDQFFNEKIELIQKELKPDSKLDKEAIANILLEVYNRSSTQTKFSYPCPMCNNLKDECIICDLLVEEIQSYK